jgi:pyrroloquinoline quinone biosynthesis protein B
MSKLLCRLIAVLLLASSFAAAEDPPPYIYVLGIAQDAGYPQTNCYQPHCMRAWETPEYRRLAASIAVVDEQAKSKFLFDATPDMREQLYELNLVAPDGEYSLDGVFLTHGHIGHYTGLMHFGHEASGTHNVPVYSMPRMQEFLSSNGPWDQLVRYENIALIDLNDGVAAKLNGRLTVTPFIVPHRAEYTEPVGYRIDGPNKSALFIPDIDKWERWEMDIRDLIATVDYALLDATFFADGEIPSRAMEDIPHPFVSESMVLFEGLSDEDKQKVIFIHMNHTNPLLIDGSEEQQMVLDLGFRFASEGMRLSL